MEPTKDVVFILIIADSNFINLCKNPEEYVEKLKSILGKDRLVNLHTVNGKYGLSNIENSNMELLELNDRNRTLFSQMLENSIAVYDEFVVISNSLGDPFLLSAREIATNHNKTFTNYRYFSKTGK